MAETKIKSSGLSANLSVSNLSLTGTTSVSGNIIPTSNNAINLGTPTLRFGSLYLSGNTIDLGGAQITTTASGDLSFNTASGNVAITANTVSFLTTVANTVSDPGNVSFDSNVRATAVVADAYFYTNGAAFTGGGGSVGYTGSRGETGLGFTIAKTYTSVTNLYNDTTPTGITAGQFAIVETGSTDNPENSRLFLWNGSSYIYVSDLSGAVGITGPAGASGSAGYTGSAGSAGTNGYDGSAGSLGYTGSAGTNGYTGSAGTFSGTTSSAIVTTDATASTSTSTGALQVAGGAGIAGNVYAGSVYTNGLYWAGNGAVMSTSSGGGGGGGGSVTLTSTVYTPGSLFTGYNAQYSSRWYPNRVITVSSITGRLITAGTVPVQLNININDVAVRTLTITGLGPNISANSFSTTSTDDYITVTVTNDGAYAADLYVSFNYT